MNYHFNQLKYSVDKWQSGICCNLVNIQPKFTDEVWVIWHDVYRKSHSCWVHLLGEIKKQREGGNTTLIWDISSRGFHGRIKGRCYENMWLFGAEDTSWTLNGEEIWRQQTYLEYSQSVSPSCRFQMLNFDDMNSRTRNIFNLQPSLVSPGFTSTLNDGFLSLHTQRREARAKPEKFAAKS